MPTTASRRASVTDAATFTRCRTLGHAWDTFTPLDKRPRWGHRLYLRCVRCAMERVDVFSITGALEQRSYDAPDGYALARDETPTRDQYRLLLERELRAERRASNGSQRTTRTSRALSASRR